MINYRNNFLFLLLLFCSPILQAQIATASLDTNTISIGEQTVFRLKLEFPAGAQVVFPLLKDSLDKSITIVEKSKIDTSYPENTVTTKILSQEITITSFDSGYHPIRPIFFTVDGDTVETEPMLLGVKMVDVPQNSDIKDIKDILDVPFSFWDWIKLYKWYILSAVLLIAIVIVSIYLYRKYKKRPKIVEKKPKPLVPAHEIALAKLKELKEKKLWQNSRTKEYHVELSHILREYLENRFGTNSLDNTTDEILYEARSLDMNEEDRNKLSQVLVLADMAKFAKQNPVSYENEQSMKNAEAFVNSTRLVEKESEQEESPKNLDKE